MLTLSAQKRTKEEKLNLLRGRGKLVGVLYGAGIENSLLKLDYKEFEKIFDQTGSSALISLQVEGKGVSVLIQEVQKDPLTEKILHVDFYHPKSTEKIEVKVPLIFEGEAPAIKDLGGTLIKNIQELEVKALPQNLPREIKVNVEGLKNFEDVVSVKDLRVSEDAEILRNPEDLVASIAAPRKVEEELEKPVEKKVEEVEKAEEKEVEEEKVEGKEIKEEEAEEKKKV